MTNAKQQRKSKKARLFIGMNLIVLLFVLVAFGREYVGNIQIRQEMNRLETQRQALEEDQLDTLALIEQLSSEYYLESEARTKHGLGREGETLIVVDGDEVQGDVLGAQDDLDFVPNVKKWFYFFFDKSALTDVSL